MLVTLAVHIANDIDYMEDDVSVMVTLPGIPRIGERLFLSDQMQLLLQRKATSSLDIAQKYIHCFYGHSNGIEEVKEENLKDLSFDEFTIVTDVLYKSNSSIVHIELGKW